MAGWHLAGAVFWGALPSALGILCGILLQSHMCGSFQLMLSSSEVTEVAMVSRGSSCMKGHRGYRARLKLSF